MDTTHVNELLASSTWLRRLARRLAADEASAEDLLQDAWSVALGAPAASARSGPAWMAGVVRRLALRRRRDEGARRRRESQAARPESGPPSTDWLERAELQQRLITAVTELEEPYRTTVIGCYLEDLAPEALAKRLGVPGSTVRTRLSRALQRLRERLDRELGDRATWAALALSIAPRGPLAPPGVAAGARPFSPVFSRSGLAWLAAGAAGITLVGTLAWRAGERPEAGELAPRVEIGQASGPHATLEVAVGPPLLEVTRHPIEAEVPPDPPTVDPGTSTEGAPLEASWAVEGIVRDAGGRPLNNARLAWAEERGLPHVAESVVTDADGHYRLELEGRDAAASLATLAFWHAEHRTRRVDHRFSPAELEAGLTTCDVTLEPGASALVLVRDEHGAPVEGAHVRLTSRDSRSDGHLPPDGSEWGWRDWGHVLWGIDIGAGDTNALGECRLGSLAAGPGSLLVWCPGFLLLTRDVRVEGDGVLEVTLGRGRMVRGVVLDPSGAPLPDTRVVLDDAQQVFTDDEGRFACGGIAEDARKVTVYAEHADFAPLWKGLITRQSDERLPLDEGDLVLRLDAGRTVDVWLEDALSGLPVEATVMVEREFESRFAGSPIRETRPFGVTPVGGRLRLERLGSFVTRLGLRTEGYDPVELVLDDLATGEHVALRPARHWTLVLVDAASGAPVPDGRVDLTIHSEPEPGLPSYVSPMLPPAPPGSNRIEVDSQWIPTIAGSKAVWFVSATGYRRYEGVEPFGEWAEGDVTVVLEPD